MKVALVSDAVAPWHVGGKEHRYRELLAHMPKDADITVYTMRWWDGDAPAGHEALMKKRPMYRLDGRRSSWQALLFALSCLRLLNRRMDVIEADHMPGPQLIVLKFVATFKRVPLVVAWHEHWGKQGWLEYLPGKWWIGAGVEWLGARCADIVVAGIESTRQRLINSGVPARRVELVPYGVHVSDPGCREERRGVVAFGRLIPHKRFDLAISAIAEGRKTGVEIPLRIIGDGPERGKLENLAHKLEVADLVEFTGALSTQRDVWCVVQKSQACIMPSEREGFGLAVAESLWLGTPVIVSDHRDNASQGLITEGLNGYIASSGDAEDFAVGLQVLQGIDHENIAHTFRTSNLVVPWEESARRLYEVWVRARERKLGKHE